MGPEFGSPLSLASKGPDIGVLVGVSDSEYLTFVSSSSEGSTSPSSLESLDSEVSLSSSFLSSIPVMEDFSLFITCLLTSSPESRESAPLGVLCTGQAELVLLFGLMKFLRSSSLPAFSFEYLRSDGPDFRRQVSLRSLFLIAGPGRPLLSSLIKKICLGVFRFEIGEL